MDLYVRFEFDAIINKGFRIKNPATVPCEGEVVDFVWEDFVKDPEDLVRVQEFSENGCFMANVFMRTYAKGYAEVLVILMEENAYAEYIADREDDKRRYAQKLRNSRMPGGLWV